MPIANMTAVVSSGVRTWVISAAVGMGVPDSGSATVDMGIAPFISHSATLHAFERRG
jgi:hypothetical protein